MLKAINYLRHECYGQTYTKSPLIMTIYNAGRDDIVIKRNETLDRKQEDDGLTLEWIDYPKYKIVWYFYPGKIILYHTLNTRLFPVTQMWRIMGSEIGDLPYDYNCWITSIEPGELLCFQFLSNEKLKSIREEISDNHFDILYFI